MSKSIEDFLSEMKEPERSEALENRRNYKANLTKEKRIDYLSDNSDIMSISYALISAFYWSDTNGGYPYWDSIYLQYIKK